MKKTLILLCTLFAVLSCSQKEVLPIEQRCIIKNLPKEITVYDFVESYDQPYGKWHLDFKIANNTKKVIDIVQVDADLYINGKKEGTVTGGNGNVEPNKYVEASFSWILPKVVPDSIVFKRVM